MLANIFLWVLIGTVGGLVVFFAYPTKKEYLSGLILAGIAGAFFGGVFYSILKIGSLAAAIDPGSLGIAAIFTVIVLKAIFKMAKPEEDFLAARSRNGRLP